MSRNSPSGLDLILLHTHLHQETMPPVNSASFSAPHGGQFQHYPSDWRSCIQLLNEEWAGLSPGSLHRAILRPKDLLLHATDSPFVANVELRDHVWLLLWLGLNCCFLCPEQLPAIATTDFRSLSTLAQIADAPHRVPSQRIREMT